MIDLKHELRRELSMIEAPDLWERIQAAALDDGVASVRDLTNVRSLRRASLWLAAAAVVAVVVLVGSALTGLVDDNQGVDTVPADRGEPVPPGPVREPSDVVQGIGSEWKDDPDDASEVWADIEVVEYQSAGQPHWYIVLEGAPPHPAEVEEGVLIAYGLVLDTNGDGAADHVIGIDNDAPVPGDFHVWVTDLATGDTIDQIGPPYGLPVEFGHPSEEQPPDIGGSPTMVFTFLRGTAPAGLDPATVRFYAWTSASRDGVVFAEDYAPDTGWITDDVDRLSSTESQPAGPG